MAAAGPQAASLPSFLAHLFILNFTFGMGEHPIVAALEMSAGSLSLSLPYRSMKMQPLRCRGSVSIYSVLKILEMHTYRYPNYEECF